MSVRAVPICLHPSARFEKAARALTEHHLAIRAPECNQESLATEFEVVMDRLRPSFSTGLRRGAKKLNNDQVSSGVLLVIGVATCLGALSYDLGALSSPGAGFMPFLAGLAIILFSGMGFIHGSIRRKKGERWILLMQGFQWKKAALILVALTAYALLLEPLGFLTCTVFFIAFLLRAIVPQRWPVVIMGGLAAALASYVIFEIWLQAQLPKGPWGV